MELEWKNFLLAFVPIFVAVDALGILPLYMGLVEDIALADQRRVIKQSLVTALVVAIGFVFLGKSVFHLMGISIEDFMVAGGALLFIIATLDLVSNRKYARRIETMGAVPIGIPLIVGPAVLTTSLMISNVYGLVPTLLALIVNIGIAGLVLLSAGFWTRLLGQAGSQAFSKVANLILAAIAVMMIRRGFTLIVAEIIRAHTHTS